MSVDKLLDFIAQPESRGDYDAVWGGIKKQHRPRQPITKMTIGQVLDWQDGIDPLYMSEASGAWQFMEDTLRGLYRSAGLSLTDRFSPANQRVLALALLRRRGLDDYLAGKISATKFANNLSKEWASLPCTIKDRNGRPAQGQSYYAGDGLNKSHVSISDLMKAVNDSKMGSAMSVPAPVKSRAKSTTLQAAAGTAVAGAGTVTMALGKLDPVAQYIVLGFAGIGALCLLWIVKERLRKWANGDTK